MHVEEANHIAKSFRRMWIEDYRLFQSNEMSKGFERSFLLNFDVIYITNIISLMPSLDIKSGRYYCKSFLGQWLNLIFVEAQQGPVQRCPPKAENLEKLWQFFKIVLAFSLS